MSLRKAQNVGGIVFASPEMEGVVADADLFAHLDVPVLVTGETGVGKERVVRRIHSESRRKSRPLVVVDSTSLSTPDLAHSKLFGHEKGSFTSANARAVGDFESADGGVVYIDEIGDLSPEIQPKLLRALDGYGFHRLGGTTLIRPDVRLVAATNRNLSAGVVAGRFKADLFYRIAVAGLAIPPLRARRLDIPALVAGFLASLKPDVDPVTALSEEAWTALMTARLGGNVRQLKHLIEFAFGLAAGGQIERRHLRFVEPGFAEADATARGTGNSELVALVLEDIDRKVPYREVAKRHGVHLSKVGRIVTKHRR